MRRQGEPLDGALLATLLGECPVSLHLYDEIDSTNSEAKRYALGGGEAPAAFLAERQSGGRGRVGRSFYSPRGTGVYLTLLLPMRGELTDGVLLTSASAVAVRRAIARVTGIEVGIKWVNDLYLHDRKVCGILAESFFVGAERRVALGVGVNLYTEEFPEELSEIAGSLGEAEEGLRNPLAAELIRQLYDMAEDPAPERFLEEYRRASVVLGREILYTENGETFSARAEEIDGRGRLWVCREDGARVCLASGEISLRVQKK